MGESVHLRRQGDLQNWQLADIGKGGSRLNAVVHTPSAEPRPERTRLSLRSPLVCSVALFAGIVFLRFSTHSSQPTGILLLLIAPIVVMSLAYGPLIGVPVACAAFAANLVSQLVDGNVDALALSTRAFAYFAIPLAIWLARKDADRRPVVILAAEAPEPATEAAVKPLTTRELEVLGLVAAGHTNGQIAEKLFLSTRTVESHRASLRRKLGYPSHPELVRHAEREGVIEGEHTSTPIDAVPASDGESRVWSTERGEFSSETAQFPH
jgi:DNA-binding CsgD family transcriptional regulator